MHANLASIMPQITAVWCEEEGHDVTFVCFTGLENLGEELSDDVDLVIISAFSQAAQLSYALSNFFRSRGAVTVLGGPHARCYPQDSQKYFDYVLGFTDKSIIQQILRDCEQHRPEGVFLAAKQQPTALPSVEERWKFIEPTMKKAPLIKIVPMIGSLGCPYTCSFCIDSTVPYQPLAFDALKNDLKFLLKKVPRPRVGWHDPNFGVRFNDYMEAIEEAIPPGRADFIAESSLSILTEAHVKRLAKNGFKAMLPGVESWYDLGNKSKTGSTTGLDKVKQVSEHINMVMRHIPYVQTNFVVGLDSDEGPEPFELTKKFIDMTPGAFPGYSMLSSFGQAAPLNLEYQRANRLLPFPHHFLDNNQAMNVRPKNYTWKEFYGHLIDLTSYSFSWPSIGRRFSDNRENIPRLMNVIRAISSEGFGRTKYHKQILGRLDSDPQFRPFFEQETTDLPDYYTNLVKKDLGPFWDWLPDGALHHDPNAYLKASVKDVLDPLVTTLSEDETLARAAEKG
jgi:hypothetical protein